VFRPEDHSIVERPALSIWDGKVFRESQGSLSHIVERFGDQEIAMSRVSLAKMTTKYVDAYGRQRAFIGSAGADRPLIFYCGGTAFDRVRYGYKVMAELLPMGDPIVWDYPGYGDSPGEPSIAAFETLTPEIVDWIDALAGERRLIIWGHSLGGAICAEIARQSEAVDFLVLEASLGRGSTSAKSAARAVMPIPLPMRVADNLTAIDVAESVNATDLPVLVLIPGDDEVIAPKIQRELATRIGAVEMSTLGPDQRRAFVEFDILRHNSILGSFEPLMRVRKFFEHLGWPHKAGMFEDGVSE